MMIERARHADTPAIAGLLERAARGKSHPKVCRNRAHQCIRNSFGRGESYSLVAKREGEVVGFLYAHQRDAFDLATGISYLEVVFLVGKGCARSLLRHLRTLTHKRIVIAAWRPLVNVDVMDRFLRALGFRNFGAIYEW